MNQAADLGVTQCIKPCADNFTWPLFRDHKMPATRFHSVGYDLSGFHLHLPIWTCLASVVCFINKNKSARSGSLDKHLRVEHVIRLLAARYLGLKLLCILSKTLN